MISFYIFLLLVLYKVKDSKMLILKKGHEYNHEQYLDITSDDILKEFLRRVYVRKIEYDNFKVHSLETSDSPISDFTCHRFDDLVTDTNIRILNNAYTVFNVTFNEQDIVIIFLKFFTRTNDHPSEFLARRGYCEGDIMIQIKEKIKKLISLYPLIDFLNAEVLKNSLLNNRILQYNKNYNGLLASFSFMNPAPTSKDNIFVPILIKEQLSRFVDSILRFRDYNTSLRFLFNGEPGTGKTQLVNSILNEINSKITSVVIRETDFPIKEIFEFAEMFQPCLVIFDDLDLILKERDNSSTTEKSNLSTFLQYLDGLLPKSIFVLATTNDKTLVDKAASRPGRFDLIIDVGEIEPQNYFDLIQRESEDNDILDFFTEKVLLNLADKKVTGAFLVNLIKQFKNIKLSSGNITKAKMKEYLDFSFRGFYKTNVQQSSTGFGFASKPNSEIILNKNAEI